MPLFGRKNRPETTRTATPAQSQVVPADQPALASSPSGWADIDAIRAEWPREQLNPDEDRRAWEEGMRLYENDDYASMMRSASLMARGLAHALYGPGILHGAELPETTHHVLYASLEAPPDGRTFAESAQRAARLALTILRENSWQPARYGGRIHTDMFEPIIMDKGNYMLLSTAIAPDGRGWEGDLPGFFAVAPQPVVQSIPHSLDDTIDRMHNMVKRAEAGDEASQLHARGMGLWMNGDLAGALEALEQAGRLGDSQAMKDAGDLCSELGRDGEARFWFESAANAGNAQGMFNMGAFAIRAGDRALAATWFQRSAEAGDPEAYAALTQLADEAGDPQGERRWAQLGAEAGQHFCMFRHGLYLTMDADGVDTPLLRRALAFLEAAAERRDDGKVDGGVAVDAMMMAGDVNSQLGDDARARMWFERARATGNPKALQMLEKHGL